MNIRRLIRESVQYGLLLNVLFFAIYRRRLQQLAASVQKETAQPTKRSPFVYNMR